MKTKSLSEHRSQLLERLAEVDAATVSIKAELAESAQTQTNFLKDSLDHTVEQNELNARIELHERYMGERKQILTALASLNNGQFGECRECCQEISARRLAVHPAASLCLECQHQKEAHTGSGIASVHKLIFSNMIPFFTTPLEVA